MNIQKPSHRKCQLVGVKWIALLGLFICELNKSVNGVADYLPHIARFLLCALCCLLVGPSAYGVSELKECGTVQIVSPDQSRLSLELGSKPDIFLPHSGIVCVVYPLHPSAKNIQELPKVSPSDVGLFGENRISPLYISILGESVDNQPRNKSGEYGYQDCGISLAHQIINGLIGTVIGTALAIFICFPNVRDHRHRTAGATSAGSVATKHSACQRGGVRWIAWLGRWFDCLVDPFVVLRVVV